MSQAPHPDADPAAFEPDSGAVEELESLMVELSGLVFASWMNGVEFALWDAVEGNPRWYTDVEVPAAMAERAKRLSERIRGWVAWPEDWARPSYVPMNEWKRRADARRTGDRSSDL